ncbi:MAG: CopG family ribbon-helix-helix protein [Candidatus Acidiferrum sp.]
MSDAVTVELDEATIGTLDRLTQKTGRSRDSLVAEAVQDYLALNSWQLEKNECGIAATERGDFATIDEISRVRAKFMPQP